MNIKHLTVFFLLTVCFNGLVPDVEASERQSVQPAIDWAELMRRHDMKWTRMPREWYEGPFLGNGMMGTLVRQTGDTIMRWDVGRGDVQEHGKAGGRYQSPRMPVGHFELHTVGTITGGDMHLSLWNAEATGTIKTDKGSIQWRSFVHTDLMVIVTEIEPSEGERQCRWEWKPGVATRGKRGQKRGQTAKKGSKKGKRGQTVHFNILNIRRLLNLPPIEPRTARKLAP